MFTPEPHEFTVPANSPFDAATAPTRVELSEPKKRLATSTRQLADLQRKLYADDRFSLLLIFQAMDAAGKDSTIRSVFTGVNPAGFQVSSFKKPSAEELDHDFLWRTAKALPERGRIGVFNRSYYEEVIVVRVHPGFLDAQRLPPGPIDDHFWRQRLQSIADHEAHLARNGTVVLKFWLNVSADEQRQRLLDRLDKPHKRWKFNSADLDERGLWPQYMAAYSALLPATSRPWAPWYAIPADSKRVMRAMVADIVVRTLTTLPISFPQSDTGTREDEARWREQLKAP